MVRVPGHTGGGSWPGAGVYEGCLEVGEAKQKDTHRGAGQAEGTGCAGALKVTAWLGDRRDRKLEMQAEARAW